MIEYIVLGVCVLIFLGAIAFVVVAGLARFLRKPPAPVRQPPLQPPVQAVAELRRYEPPPPPDLLDLHIDYQDRRDRQIRREAQQRRLDQATLEREALIKIGQVLTPPTPPADPSAATPPPNA